MEREIPKGAVRVAKGTLGKGFRYEFIDLAVFCDSELFGGKEKKKRKNAAKTVPPLKASPTCVSAIMWCMITTASAYSVGWRRFLWTVSRRIT